MPPHLIQRGPKKIHYIVDGRTVISTRTAVKRFALLQLEKYSKGKLKIDDGTTVKDYYDKWIAGRESALGAKNRRVKDYKTHFGHIIREMGDVRLSDVDFTALTSFRDKLAKGRSMKTCRNIVDGSFRAMWREIMKAGIVRESPFELLEWERGITPAPTPFTPEERDTIIAHWFTRDVFYYPWVFVQFHTGMRPSETAALMWPDIDMKEATITIVKSLDMGEDEEGDTKTRNSRRIIPMSDAVQMVFSIMPRWNEQYVFVNKHGRPLSKKWAEHNWKKTLNLLKIPYRKFYCTRHTFITEAIRAGDSPLAVAQYCGTSLEMIERNYCGRVKLPSLHATKLQQGEVNPFVSIENVSGKLVAGPGFERGRLLPGISQLRKIQRELTFPPPTKT